MINTISNRFLEISVNSRGAELMSLKTSDKKQLLWQGDQKFWARRAPVLFPIVGCLPDDKYELDGKVYEMGIHGFAGASEFQPVSEGEDELSYALTGNEETMKSYPFHFEFIVGFKLLENTLKQVFRVKNTDSRSLPFSFGSHPGFNCPLLDNETMEDYRLIFEKKEYARKRLLSGRLLSNETAGFLNYENEKVLRHDMFDEGAIILSGLKSKWVELKSMKSGAAVRIDFTGFPYLLVWSPPFKKAPFICIELCNGIGSCAGSDGGFLEKEGLIFLEPGKTFESAVSFICNV